MYGGWGSDYIDAEDVAIAYRNNPISNLWENVADQGKPPEYVLRKVYPAYPWKMAKFQKIGDGKDSKFIPLQEEPDDHSKDDALKFWQRAQLYGAIEENTPPPVLEGYVVTEEHTK